MVNHVTFTHTAFTICTSKSNFASTYDHRTLKIELPVRSAVLKQCTGGLVVRWVTTSEYPLLYVFAILLDVTKGEEGRWRDESGSFWWLDKRARSK
jgi:hypothetical protein